MAAIPKTTREAGSAGDGVKDELSLMAEDHLV